MSRAEAILAELEHHGIHLGLEHLRALHARLDEPAARLPAVLVAGTNGKGSTAAQLDAIARAAGYRVGLYTSPHLESVTERLRIDGTSVSEDRLAARLEEVLAASRSLADSSPTFFEALTLAGFLELAAAELDLVVLEVGMGGRLDATNLAEPLLSVVTAIDFDHQEWLGSTLDLIAREKAGILRAGREAVIAPQAPEASAALAAEVARLGSAAHWVGADTELAELAFRAFAGLDLVLRTRAATYRLTTALPGRHQATNVATAVLAAERLHQLGFHRLSSSAIERGVKECRWPGRLEAVPLPEGRTILLDAAHNPGGCRTLVDFLDEIERPWSLLFGALSDKSIPEMLPTLARRARHVVLTEPPSPRAARVASLSRWLPAATSAVLEPVFERGLGSALDAEDSLLVVCGSIYLVGAVRRSLRTRFGVPPPLSR